MDEEEYMKLGGPQAIPVVATDNEAVIDILKFKVPRYIETISRCLEREQYFNAVRCMMELISNLTVTASAICNVRLSRDEFKSLSEELAEMESPVVGVLREELDGEEG